MRFGEAVELAELAREIGRMTNRPELIQFTSDVPSTAEAPLIVAGQRRLRGEIAWHPRYTLRQGLAETINWWRSEQVLPNDKSVTLTNGIPCRAPTRASLQLRSGS
jgi:nucleoside-diphosphate-sugar epimerase